MRLCNEKIRTSQLPCKLSVCCNSLELAAASELKGDLIPRRNMIIGGLGEVRRLCPNRKLPSVAV
jgi:hypothetical protein